MNISELIKNRRKELKLSPATAAEKLGISRATYYRYEKSCEKIPSSIIEPLSELLQLPPAMLLGINNLDLSLNKAEKALKTTTEASEAELYIEQLSQVLGYCLIKDYSTKDNKNISAIAYNDDIHKISEDEYKAIISSIKDFALFKLSTVYNTK